MNERHVPWMVQLEAVIDRLEARLLLDELSPCHCLFGALHDDIFVFHLSLDVILAIAIIADLLWHEVAILGTRTLLPTPPHFLGWALPIQLILVDLLWAASFKLLIILYSLLTRLIAQFFGITLLNRLDDLVQVILQVEWVITVLHLAYDSLSETRWTLDFTGLKIAEGDQASKGGSLHIIHGSSLRLEIIWCYFMTILLLDDGGFGDNSRLTIENRDTFVANRCLGSNDLDPLKFIIFFLTRATGLQNWVQLVLQGYRLLLGA